MQHTWVTTMALKINDTIRATRVGGRRPLSAIRAIVFHYTANTGLHATALGNARYFANGSEGRAASCSAAGRSRSGRCGGSCARRQR